MKVEPVRVIVTANHDDGRSFVLRDQAATDPHVQPGRPTALTDIWHIAAVPADAADQGTRLSRHPFTLVPPDGGISFRVVQFDPMTNEQYTQLNGNEVFASMNAGDEHVRSDASPLMHRTRTVDFGLVLRGTITMVLDDDRVDVSQGDVIIQRATNHAWENRGDEPALVAFVLIDAKGEVND